MSVCLCVYVSVCGFDRCIVNICSTSTLVGCSVARLVGSSMSASLADVVCLFVWQAVCLFMISPDITLCS